jgi:hypothetical protein
MAKKAESRGEKAETLSKPRTEFPMTPPRRSSVPGDACYALQHSVWLLLHEFSNPAMTEWSRPASLPDRDGEWHSTCG